MITHLQATNFKSWRDTGLIRMAPLTGFFGANSSGKTALLQLLLMMKQTVESPDRSRVLHTGDERTYVDLGTFYDISFAHQVPGEISLTIGWSLPYPISIADPDSTVGETLFSLSQLELETRVAGSRDGVAVAQFRYRLSSGGRDFVFGVSRKKQRPSGRRPEYDLISEGHEIRRPVGRAWPLPAPVKSYGFPDQVNAYYQNAGFLSAFVLAFEELFQRVYYLGPLREYPHRSYVWGGEQPQDVGRRGELAVPALLATRKLGPTISRGRGRKKQTVEERVAEWLRDLGLVAGFDLKPIAEDRRDYEVKVRRSQKAADVLITDVGFGVSQILPVLVLCYYAPEGSTIILEQPEIHLHPSVQAGLADVFVDIVKTRNVQVILESHSEHLLRRLQRRVAESVLTDDEVALYFTSSENGQSNLLPLQMDLFGNITNWPAGFFGDEMGDLIAMTEAEMHRKQSEIFVQPPCGSS